MPALPRVELPHPVAGTDRAVMATIARSVSEAMIAALRGPVTDVAARS